jgi:acetylornithine/succinyldiaminopimelate/putrescine aminotransferase
MHGNVIRVTPPLNVSKADVDEFAARLNKSLCELSTAHAK